MTQQYSHFTSIVGSNRTAAFPVFDAETNHFPRLISGPGYARTAFRWFIRMPDASTAERFPAPMGRDRSTLCFTPIMILLQGGYLPPDTSAEFHHLLGPSGLMRIPKGRKHQLHQWDKNIDSGLNPYFPLDCPALYPGQALEIHGVSFFHAPKSPRRKSRPSPPMLKAIHNYTPPEIKTVHPVNFQVLCSLSWLPLPNQKTRVEFVEGSPLRPGASTDNPKMNEEREGHPMNQAYKRPSLNDKV